MGERAIEFWLEDRNNTLPDLLGLAAQDDWSTHLHGQDVMGLEDNRASLEGLRVCDGEIRARFSEHWER